MLHLLLYREASSGTELPHHHECNAESEDSRVTNEAQVILLSLLSLSSKEMEHTDLKNPSVLVIYSMLENIFTCLIKFGSTFYFQSTITQC